MRYTTVTIWLECNKKPPERAVFVSIGRGWLDDLFRDAFEDFRTIGCEFSEDFAVECESGFLELVDERAVGSVAVCADSGIQADDPELAEVGLLVASVSECVAAGAHEGLMGEVELLGADATVSLRSLEDVLAALIRVYSTFDSCHT